MTIEELQVLITANTKQLQKEINNTNKTIASLKKSADKTQNGVLSAFDKLKSGIIALGIGNVIKNSIMSGMNAIESDNLFETSLGNMADSVRSWSDEIGEALGLDAVAMRKNTGVIYNMTSSMGVAEENALKMSKGISLLTEDMASFYNLSSDEAFNKLRAGLTGEAEPLKALGILVDENTIKQVAYQQGIAQTGAELTNQQKVLARYVAILMQTGNAQGDLARTINQPANQLRLLKNQVVQLGRAFGNVLMPLVRAVIPYLIAFTKVVTQALNGLAKFLGISTGSTGMSGMATDVGDVSSGLGGVADTLGDVGDNIGKASSGLNDVNDGLSDANKNAKKLKGQLAGFDEMTVLTEKDTSSGTNSNGAIGSGIGGNLSDATLGAIGGVGADGLFDLGEYNSSSLGLDDLGIDLEEFKEKLKSILVLVGLTASAFATWKILDWITAPTTNLAQTFSKIGGYALIVAGALALITGYSDAWANGVDWGNLALTIGGLGAIITGLYLTLGTFAMSLGVVAGGIALVVLGVVDFINNGATLQNTILIIGGAIAVAVGLATGGLSVLASVITGVVVGIGAFITALVLEEPAIMSVTDAQNNLTEAKNRAVEAENSYVNAVDSAEASMKRLEEAEKKAGVTGEELYKQVQNGTLDYADMTDAQKEVYKAYLDNEQKQKDLKKATEDLNKAKKEETLASYENQLALAKESGNYDEFKKSVVDAFEKGELSAEECRDLISKSMSEMSDDSQKTFMKDLPSDIKNGLDPHKYESTGTKLKKWFSNTWSDIKKGASNLWDNIKEIFSKVGEKIGEAVSDTVKKAINSVLSTGVKIINGFISAINLAIDVINAIPGVKITKLNKLEVPKLARGGVVDSPTIAMIGEAGKEAVVPLERTEWVDKLAEKINSKGGNGQPQHITIKLGEETIFDKFIDYTKEKSFETNGEVFSL